MVHGERIDLDVVFHCGKILRNVSESVLRGGSGRSVMMCVRRQN